MDKTKLDKDRAYTPEEQASRRAPSLRASGVTPELVSKRRKIIKEMQKASRRRPGIPLEEILRMREEGRL